MQQRAGAGSIGNSLHRQTFPYAPTFNITPTLGLMILPQFVMILDSMTWSEVSNRTSGVQREVGARSLHPVSDLPLDGPG
jgi:hypothetical protein